MIELSQHQFVDSKSQSQLQANAVNLIGFRFDGTSCFRKGADFGPDAIRECSDGLESYSPYLNKSLEDISFYDLGNLPHHPVGTQGWQKTNEAFDHLCTDKNLREQNIKILTLGGEHSISYAPIKKYLQDFPELILIHLDAHADLRDGYEGYHYSHASIIFRVKELFSDKNDLIQYGIRSGTKSEFELMKEWKTQCRSRTEFLQKIEEIKPNRPVYLTLDLDFFDPSFLPGTGTPEPGGEDFHTFVSLMKILQQKNLVGADVVELAPNIDPTGNSAVFAAKVVRELSLVLA